MRTTLKTLLRSTAIAGALALSTPVWMAGAAQAADCALTDVGLTIGGTNYAPTSCDNGILTGNSPGAIESSFNTAFPPGGFSLLAKYDDGGNETGSSLGGITFEILSADIDATSGSWTFGWTDTDQGTAPNLPQFFDLGVVLKGGSADDAAYLFEDVLIPESPNTGSGSFVITFLNSGGNVPELSFIAMLGRATGDGPDPIPTPEPASLALLGVGLVGLGALSRRRRRRA
jgi:hypothetical protein